MCYISNQIAKHCDDEEIYCDVCQSTMCFDEFRPTVLVCDKCAHEFDMGER